MSQPVYTPKRELRSYQKTAVRKLVSLGFGGALFMEQRTGKTKTSIDYLNVLVMLGKVDRVLVIVPKIAFKVWVDSMEDDCTVNYRLDFWDAKARNEGVFPKSGNEKLHVVVTNYEAFSAKGRVASSKPGKTKAKRLVNRDLTKEWLQGACKGSLIILDESHKIKNMHSHIHKNIVALRDSVDYRVICTGTPLTKAEKVRDLWAQGQFLCPEYFSRWKDVNEFEAYFTYFTVEGIGSSRWKKYFGLKHEDELQELIQSISFRITRVECIDLPEKQVFTIPVELSDRTKSVYNSLVEDSVVELEEAIRNGDWERKAKIEAHLPVVLNLRLTQITGGWTRLKDQETGKYFEGYQNVSNEKMLCLMELLDEFQENEEKVIVCAMFKPEIGEIKSRCELKGIPVWVISGGIPDHERIRGIDDFNNLSGCGVMIIQPQAGGVGIDLSTAQSMIWYSLPNSFVNYSQASDRNALHCKGAAYYYLIASGTIDEKSFTALQESKDASENLLDIPRGIKSGASVPQTEAHKYVESITDAFKIK